MKKGWSKGLVTALILSGLTRASADGLGITEDIEGKGQQGGNEAVKAI